MKPDARTIAKLPDQEGAELLTHLEALEFEQRTNKIKTLYPETGPLRRELYPKHMAFFASGLRYRERAAIAANRCISPFTPIEMGSSTRLISELLGEEGFYVSSWDGSSRCKKKAGGAFLKSIEPMFRLTISNGQYLDCTLGHLLLTSSGWLSLGQLVQRSSGLHCWRRCGDCQANYGTNIHRHDVYSHYLEGIFDDAPPSRGGVRERLQYKNEQKDVAERIFQYNHILEACAHLPSEMTPDQIGDLCAQSESQAFSLESLLSYAQSQELSRFAGEFAQSATFLKECHRQRLLLEESSADKILSYACEERSSGEYEVSSGIELFVELIAAHQSKSKFLECGCRREVYVPLSHTPLIGQGSILSIESVGIQPVLDFTVEETHCYESGGIISHNTGKSFGIGGYETTLHLTGDYPSWWCGRRFNSPTEIWVAGDTTETTRDIIQQILMGNPGEMGTGLIPQSCIIGNPTHRAGVAGAMDSVRIKHKSGGTSTLGFKCFAAGTKIKMADNSVVPIEKVALGQEVACVGDRIGQVSATHSYYNTPLIKISTRLGWITVTPNHEMFTNRGKVEAGSLTLDDSLETAGLRKVGRVFEKITDIYMELPNNSYCITVEPYHELIAGGYRVGNSYDQGRKKFQGTAKNCIWLDEQPPVDVYTECLTRLMTKDGSMICTFTPLEGLSDVVLMYLPEMAPNVGGIPGMGEDWEE